MARPIYGIDVTLNGDKTIYSRKIAQERVFAPKCISIRYLKAKFGKLILKTIPAGNKNSTNMCTIKFRDIQAGLVRSLLIITLMLCANTAWAQEEKR